jgi:hypothetical protein
VRRLLIALAVVISSCGPVFTIPQASPQFSYYQYTVAIPTTPLAPNQQLHLIWEPHLSPAKASAASTIQLCVAFFGPWETVAALKTAMSTAGPGPSCPPKGAIVSSETLRTTSNTGAFLTTDLVVPAAPGFYDIHQISIAGESPQTSATAAGGIVEVRTK